SYNDSPSYGVDNWGKGSIFGDSGYRIKTVAAGRDTGGVAFRGTGNALVSFVDGHAKALKPGALAAGTNWNPNLNASAMAL
ncbi:hypothetical protein OVW19_31030, partial [Klebsiella pneumoniae]|uniref:hypothetical protein n=1 Tax=Klebsiella pneumoniae TaxID=573 RepID=UPI0022715673